MQALIITGQRRRNATKLALFMAILLATLAVGLGSSDSPANAAPGSPHFVGAWGASPQEPPTDANSPGSPDTSPQFEDQTIRNVVNTHIGGDKVRIRLSNEFGDRPVTFKSIFIGRESRTSDDAPDDPSINEGTNKRLTFGGKKSVTLKPGEEMYSDPVKLRVRPFQDLAISFYLPNLTGPATQHTNAVQDNFVATGNQASDETGAGFTPAGESWYFLTDVDVVRGRRLPAWLRWGTRSLMGSFTSRPAQTTAILTSSRSACRRARTTKT